MLIKCSDVDVDVIFGCLYNVQLLIYCLGVDVWDVWVFMQYFCVYVLFG